MPYLNCCRNENHPPRGGGAILDWLSAVAYFSPRGGSIIGAGSLSFGVRDGTGRFPAAMDRRNSILLCSRVNLGVLVVGCGHPLVGWFVVWLRAGCVSY